MSSGLTEHKHQSFRIVPIIPFSPWLPGGSYGIILLGTPGGVCLPSYFFGPDVWFLKLGTIIKNLFISIDITHLLNATSRSSRGGAGKVSPYTPVMPGH